MSVPRAVKQAAKNMARTRRVRVNPGDVVKVTNSNVNYWGPIGVVTQILDDKHILVQMFGSVDYYSNTKGNHLPSPLLVNTELYDHHKHDSDHPRIVSVLYRATPLAPRERVVKERRVRKVRDVTDLTHVLASLEETEGVHYDFSEFDPSVVDQGVYEADA